MPFLIGSVQRVNERLIIINNLIETQCPRNTARYVVQNVYSVEILENSMTSKIRRTQKVVVVVASYRVKYNRRLDRGDAIDSS